jgi:coproporphyrinogen III oxidase-like Fe-S oxidoreductase
MKTILSFLAIVSAVALLAGCRTTPYSWYKPGATPEQTQSDIRDCRQQADALPPLAPSVSPVVVDKTGTYQNQYIQQQQQNRFNDQMNREQYFRACLQAKGYTNLPTSQIK